MRLKLSSRLILTIVIIQIVVLAVLIWNNQRIYKQSHVERQELTYSAELAYLVETISIGMIYADRAMLSENLQDLQARSDFGYAVSLIARGEF